MGERVLECAVHLTCPFFAMLAVTSASVLPGISTGALEVVRREK